MTAVPTTASYLQQQRRGYAEFGTTQIYAAAVSERRRATVLAMDFRPERKPKKRTKRSA